MISTNDLLLTADLSRWSQQLISTDELNRLIGKLVDWIISLPSQPQPSLKLLITQRVVLSVWGQSQFWNLKSKNWKWNWIHKSEIWNLKCEIWNMKYATWNPTTQQDTKSKFQFWNLKSEIWNRNLTSKAWHLKPES